MIGVILILLLCAVWFHVWFRVKDMKTLKKAGYSFASFFVFLIIFGFTTIDSGAKADLLSEQEKNEELTETVSVLEVTNEDLESQLEKLNISVTDLEDELTAITEEKDALEEKFDSIEKDNKKLTDEAEQAGYRAPK